MMIKYVKGDLLETNAKNIIHGCNSHGVMGSGVAKAIRAKYPQAYQDYQDIYNRRGLELGDMIISVQNDNKTIYNAITQQDYGRDPLTVYVSYWAIAEVFRKVNTLGIDSIAMPMIGAGLANGDWDVISAIIENTLTRVRPVVYVL